MDTLEQHLRDTIADRAARTQTPPAPLEQTLRAGRTARRRHRATLITLAAVAATVAALSVPGVLDLTGGSDARPARSGPSQGGSPTLDGEPQPAPNVKPQLRPEEQRLVDAFTAAGMREAGVFEHGAPGDAWVSATLPTGLTAVAHTNAQGIVTPGEKIAEVTVAGTRMELLSTETLGLVGQFTCADYTGEVTALDNFAPTATRAQVRRLAQDLLAELDC